MKPAISVIVPCRNERDQIEACVRSIMAQEVPTGGFEIIVADGRSDDGTLNGAFLSRYLGDGYLYLKPFHNFKAKRLNYISMCGLAGGCSKSTCWVDLCLAKSNGLLSSLCCHTQREESNPLGEITLELRFWIDTKWAEIRKELESRLDYDKLEVLFSDGGPGIEENLLHPTMKQQRSTFLKHWLENGEVKAIESAVRQVNNRINRVGKRWSAAGLLNWLKVTFYKIFKPEL